MSQFTNIKNKYLFCSIRRNLFTTLNSIGLLCIIVLLSLNAEDITTIVVQKPRQKPVLTSDNKI